MAESTRASSVESDDDFQPPVVTPKWRANSLGIATNSTGKDLPVEILQEIFKEINGNLHGVVLVNRKWSQSAIPLLYHKPQFCDFKAYNMFARMLREYSPESTFDYPLLVKRLNLAPLADKLQDISSLQKCVNLERLTLSNSSLSSEALIQLINHCSKLVALDLSQIAEVDDDVVLAIAANCHSLQGLNLSNCPAVTNRSIEQIAVACPLLRRIKLRVLPHLTDSAIILLSLHCPLLLELDLLACKGITNLSMRQLLRTSIALRELTLGNCLGLDQYAFPTSSLTIDEPSTDSELTTSSGKQIPIPPPLSALPPIPQFLHIRLLDLTSLTALNDDSLPALLEHMPKIRNLMLTRCVNIGDPSLDAISKLGKWLHSLHMGHCVGISDAGILKLARSCTRLRYIDLACCNLLTDISIMALASSLPKLKRIGLVRVVALTNQSIYALLARRSLERIHLSYCEQITVQAIHELLGGLDKLTHMSLTGVPAFRRNDLQRFCRPPPKEFNAHQRASFCVYSGAGIAHLRKYLKSIAVRGIVPSESDLVGAHGFILQQQFQQQHMQQHQQQHQQMLQGQFQHVPPNQIPQLIHALPQGLPPYLHNLTQQQLLQLQSLRQSHQQPPRWMQPPQPPTQNNVNLTNPVTSQDSQQSQFNGNQTVPNPGLPDAIVQGPLNAVPHSQIDLGFEEESGDMSEDDELEQPTRRLRSRTITALGSQRVSDSNQSGSSSQSFIHTHTNSQSRTPRNSRSINPLPGRNGFEPESSSASNNRRPRTIPPTRSVLGLGPAALGLGQGDLGYSSSSSFDRDGEEESMEVETYQQEGHSSRDRSLVTEAMESNSDVEIDD